MKQGDVYKNLKDNRLYVVVMLDICMLSGDSKGEELVIMRPLKRYDNEPAYFAEYRKINFNYEYQYNLYETC